MSSVLYSLSGSFVCACLPVRRKGLRNDLRNRFHVRASGAVSLAWAFWWLHAVSWVQYVANLQSTRVGIPAIRKAVVVKVIIAYGTVATIHPLRIESAAQAPRITCAI